MTLSNPKEFSMNGKKIVSSIVAMSLTMGGFAFAQRDEPPPSDGQQNRPGNQARQQNRPGNQVRQPNRPQNQPRANINGQRDERGAGPDHQYHRGERLPVEYRHRSYVVDDWRAHNLSAPPRGYHWVQTGADYVLVAIATGIILQLMLNN
jgi:Ni/Co efflux regulator RcnB